VPFSSKISANVSQHRNDELGHRFVNPFLEFGVRRSAFTVRGSPFGIWRLACAGSRFSPISRQLLQFIYLLLYLSVMDDFTQFDAFERCRAFARAIAVHLNRGVFAKDPVLATELRKTLLSVYANFGEGFDRDGNREFAQFVSIAKGSVGETRAQLIYALDFGYLKPEVFSELDQLGKTATKCLGGLIRYLNDSSFRGRKFKQRDDLLDEPKRQNNRVERRTANAERRTPNVKR
jgi:four helix bundle protein